MRASDKFYAHFAGCGACFADFADCETSKLCAEGRELLFEAVDDLPCGWQRIAREIRRQERLESEAEANFQFYAEEDSPRG